jgi:hypothetical protein
MTTTANPVANDVAEGGLLGTAHASHHGAQVRINQSCDPDYHKQSPPF